MAFSVFNYIHIFKLNPQSINFDKSCLPFTVRLHISFSQTKELYDIAFSNKKNFDNLKIYGMIFLILY